MFVDRAKRELALANASPAPVSQYVQQTGSVLVDFAGGGAVGALLGTAHARFGLGHSLRAVEGLPLAAPWLALLLNTPRSTSRAAREEPAPTAARSGRFESRTNSCRTRRLVVSRRGSPGSRPRGGSRARTQSTSRRGGSNGRQVTLVLAAHGGRIMDASGRSLCPALPLLAVQASHPARDTEQYQPRPGVARCPETCVLDPRSTHGRMTDREIEVLFGRSRQLRIVEKRATKCAKRWGRHERRDARAHRPSRAAEV